MIDAPRWGRSQGIHSTLFYGCSSFSFRDISLFWHFWGLQAMKPYLELLELLFRIIIIILRFFLPELQVVVLKLWSWNFRMWCSSKGTWCPLKSGETCSINKGEITQKRRKKWFLFLQYLCELSTDSPQSSQVASSQHCLHFIHWGRSANFSRLAPRGPQRNFRILWPCTFKKLLLCNYISYS